MEGEHIGKYLAVTFRAHEMFVDKKLKEKGFELSRGQFFLLLGLYKNGPLPQHALCEMFNLDKAAVNRGIKKLQEKGLVRKEPSSEDKRRILLYLTQKAQEMKPEFYALLEEADREIKSGLTGDEIRSVLHILNKISRNLGFDISNPGKGGLNGECTGKQ